MKTHPLDISSLVVGLIFIGLAGSWALRASELIDADAARWILPLLLVAAGTVGIIGAVAKSLRSRRTSQHDPHQTDGELP